MSAERITKKNPEAFHTLKKSDLPRTFSRKQRLAIKDRDKNKCQAPFKHECKGDLNIHHILPVGYAITLNIDPNFPENGITLCKNAHEVVHPDTKEARSKWKPKSDVFIKTLEKRQELLNKRKIYWNPIYDRQLLVVAVRNTQQAIKKGWVFPDKDNEKLRQEEIKQKEIDNKKIEDLKKELNEFTKNEN